MKKIFFLAALLVLTLSSCKKDYTCACTAIDPAENYSFAMANSKKQKAKDDCKTYGTTYAAEHPGGVCDIK